MHIAIRPTERSSQAGRPALTPELLAACGARYSRNNEGIAAILGKIDPQNLDKSVDSIFRMVDYGHQSIADMVPVALFIDDLSIWLAYFIWTLCPTAGGQESSSRYLKISVDGLMPPEQLGIPAPEIPAWQATMAECFQAYQASLQIWEEMANAYPTLMGIPQSLLSDSTDAAKKKVARLKRNYAFDRARYFLPVAAATNVMLVMSARGWVTLCQHLLSHPLLEARHLGQLIRQELELCAPRLLKHASPTEPNRQAIAAELERWVEMARREPFVPADLPLAAPGAVPFLTVTPPSDVLPSDLAQALAHHPHRYAPVGTSLQRTSVRFGWSAIGFAEIRDLNRHRTGTKYSPQVPKGFYSALDQLPAHADPAGEKRRRLEQLTQFGLEACGQAAKRLRDGLPESIYWSLLGTEYYFEHTTTADKFIYEAELRTGLGAHYRYAKHLRDVLALWYEQFPQTKGLVLEGTAEPE